MDITVTQLISLYLNSSMLDAVVKCTVSSLSYQWEVKAILEVWQLAEENIAWENTLQPTAISYYCCLRPSNV